MKDEIISLITCSGFIIHMLPSCRSKCHRRRVDANPVSDFFNGKPGGFVSYSNVGKLRKLQIAVRIIKVPQIDNSQLAADQSLLTRFQAGHPAPKDCLVGHQVLQLKLMRVRLVYTPFPAVIGIVICSTQIGRLSHTPYSL